MTQGVNKKEIMDGLFQDGKEPGTDIFKRYTDALAEDYIARHSEVTEGDEIVPEGDGLSEEAIPVDNFEDVSADISLPDAPDVPVISEVPAPESAAPLTNVEKPASVPNTLRARRLLMARKTQPVAPAPAKTEVATPTIEVKEQPKDEVIADPDKEAAKGLEKSLPPESEEAAPLDEIIAFDGSGEVVKGSDKLTPKSQFTDTEIIPDNSSRVAEALRTSEAPGNNNLVADALKSKADHLGDQAENSDRALAALTPEASIVPEAPIAPIAEVAKEAPEIEATEAEESGDEPTIKFESTKTASPILEAAAAHEEDGTSDEAKPSVDLMMPQVGLAKPEKPVTPPDTVNITDGAVEESADKLVSQFGGVAEADPPAAVGEEKAAEPLEIIDPNPLIPEAPEKVVASSPVADADQTQVIEHLIHDGVPLEGQNTESQNPPTVEAKSPEKPLENTASVPTPPVPETAAAVAPTPTNEVVTPPLEHLVGDQQPSPALEAAAQVQQSAPAPETADPAGIWQNQNNQERKERPQGGIFQKVKSLFGGKKDTHAAPKISALSHGVMASDVEAIYSAHQAQNQEELEKAA